MPEAAMYKYGCLVFWQNNIRATWQIFAMKAEPVPAPVKYLPNHFFRHRVFAANLRHNGATFRGREYVGHCYGLLLGVAFGFL